MPVCLDCGNTTAFVHNGDGTELRIYDDDGEFLDGGHLEFETRLCRCAECENQNVRFE